MIDDALGVDRQHTNEVSIAPNVEVDRDEVVPNDTQERNEAK